MRRFKFIGDPKRYTSKGGYEPFIVGHNYDYNFIGLGFTMPISEYITFSGTRDWHEVFKEPTLQDRVQDLKDFAKGQGLKVDVVVEDIDIWEGVQYAECILNSESYTVGKIYRRNVDKFPFSIKTYQDDFGRENGQGKSYFKPSTESAYVEQLKKEANEKYQLNQLIQSGDRFELNEFIGIIPVHCGKSTYYDYIKETDTLFFKGVRIYQQGKWAKNLPKRVEVDPNSLDSISKAFNKCSDLETNKFKVFLAKQLEKYLNGEVE